MRCVPHPPMPLSCLLQALSLHGHTQQLEVCNITGPGQCVCKAAQTWAAKMHAGVGSSKRKEADTAIHGDADPLVMLVNSVSACSVCEVVRISAGSRSEACVGNGFHVQAFGVVHGQTGPVIGQHAPRWPSQVAAGAHQPLIDDQRTIVLILAQQVRQRSVPVLPSWDDELICTGPGPGASSPAQLGQTPLIGCLFLQSSRSSMHTAVQVLALVTVRSSRAAPVSMKAMNRCLWPYSSRHLSYTKLWAHCDACSNSLRPRRNTGRGQNAQTSQDMPQAWRLGRRRMP